ncbi:PF20097 family protein [Staphylococcus aureus]
MSVEPSLNKGAVLLSKQNRFSINYVEAYLCEKCEKVIINYM